MFDPMSLLRLNQMDMGGGETDDQYPLPPVQPAQISAPTPARSGIDFTPKMDAQNTFNALINNQPIEKPHGALHHIAAAIIGMGLGQDAANEFSHGAHNREMSDWLTKAKLAQQSAQDENQTNNIGKTLAIEQGKDADRDAKLAESARQADEKIKVAQQKADTSAANTEIWRGRAKTYDEMRKGGTIVWDQKSGMGYMVYKDGTKTPIDINHIPEEELIKAKAAAQKDVNAARPGAATAGTQIVQPMGPDGNPLAPVIVDKKTGSSKSINGPDGTPLAPTKVQSPDNQFKNQIITFSKFVNDPHINEQFAANGKKPHDFFKFGVDSNGKQTDQIVGLKDRKDFTSPGDLAMYDYIYNYFNGKKK